MVISVQDVGLYISVGKRAVNWPPAIACKGYLQHLVSASSSLREVSVGRKPATTRVSSFVLFSSFLSDCVFHSHLHVHVYVRKHFSPHGIVHWLRFFIMKFYFIFPYLKFYYQGYHRSPVIPLVFSARMYLWTYTCQLNDTTPTKRRITFESITIVCCTLFCCFAGLLCQLWVCKYIGNNLRSKMKLRQPAVVADKHHKFSLAREGSDTASCSRWLENLVADIFPDFEARFHLCCLSAWLSLNAV